MASIMKNISQIWRCGNLYRTAQLERLGLGSYQDTYIVNICKNPGITQEGLSKLIFVHKSNVARQVSSLEAKGFVKRVADSADKRNLLVYPTQKALDIYSEVREVQKKWNSMILEGLDENSIAMIESLTLKMAGNAIAKVQKINEE